MCIGSFKTSVYNCSCKNLCSLNNNKTGKFPLGFYHDIDKIKTDFRNNIQLEITRDLVPPLVFEDKASIEAEICA